MKIWALVDPRSDDYAHFDGNIRWGEPQGTWADEQTPWSAVADRYGVCRECTAPSPSKWAPGLTIEWQPGCDRIGDFTWDISGSWPVATESVVTDLRGRFSGIEGVEVKMVQNSKLKKPTRPNRRSKPRIWLPYTGPRLFELWVTHIVPMDLERTTARLTVDCKLCGYKRYKLEGTETIDWKWDIERQEMEWFHVPRVSGQGLFVRSSDLGKADFFAVRDLALGVLCTDRAKDFIESRGYTNIVFHEMGDVI